MAVSDYSTTPANNTTISGINIAESCAPGNINDAIRQMMADVKSEFDSTVTGALLPKYATLAAAQAATIDVDVGDVVMLVGYTGEGDGPPAIYRRVSSDPGHDGAFQDAASSWFELQPWWHGGFLVEWLGATGDGSTDDTAAIQSAINAAATADARAVHFLDKTYKITRLWLNYDATNNTGFPSGATAQGRVHLIGVGRMFSDDSTTGTILSSTETTNPAINADGDTTTGTAYKAWDVRLENLSVTQTSTTYVVAFDRVAQNSLIRNSYINQAGTGGGVHWQELWQSGMEDVVIKGAGAGSSAIGLYAHNNSGETSGGFFRLVNIDARSFTSGIVLGHQTYGSGALMHSALLLNSQASACTTGIEIGNGAQNTLAIGSQVENCTTGWIIKNGGRLHGMHCRSVDCDIGVQCGNGNSTDEDRHDVHLDGHWVDSDAATTEGVKVYWDANSNPVYLTRCKFDSDASASSDTAIWVESGIDNAEVYVKDATIDSGWNAKISDSADLREYNEAGTNLVVYRTVNVSEAHSDVPWQWRQDSTAGAMPVVEFHQRDNDEPFLRLASAITTGTTLNHITTKNTGGAVVGPGATSWTFSRMVKIELEDAGGATDYWVPCFTSTGS